MIRRMTALGLLLALLTGCRLSAAPPEPLVFSSPMVGVVSQQITFEGMSQPFASISAIAQPLTITERGQTDGYLQWWDSWFAKPDGSRIQVQFLFDVRDQCSCTLYDGQEQYSINSHCGTPLGLYAADLNTSDQALDLLYWERLDNNQTQFQIFRYNGSSIYLAGRLPGSPGDLFTDRNGTYLCMREDLIPFTDPYVATAYQQESGYILTHLPTDMEQDVFGQTFSMRPGCWYFDTQTPYDPHTLENYETAYLAGGENYRSHMRVFTGSEQVTILQRNGTGNIYYCEIDGVRGALCLFE